MKPNRNLLPRLFLFLFLVLLASLGMYLSQQPPNSLPVSTPPVEFSAERAFRHVEAFAREPRPVGTAAHLLARNYIRSELQALGLSPQIQKATVVDPKSVVDPKMVVAGTVQNVIARLAGTSGDKAILLISHYDSVATGPGASDDAAGVATLLETARALKAGPPLKNDVIFLFTDGEEVDLLGAQAFVQAHPWAKDVGLALNFDTGGTNGIVYTYEISPGNARLIYEYAKAVPYPATSSMMYEVYSSMPNESDFTPLKQAGIPGFNFAHIGGKFRYHTMIDNHANLDRRSLQHQGYYAMNLTRHFGDFDLSDLRSDSNLIYFSILNLVLLYYPEAWALPLAILAALLFVGLVVFGRLRGKISLVGLVLGTLAFLLNMLMSAGIVWSVWQGLIKVYPQYGVVIDIHNGFFYWLAFITLTLAITAAFYNLLRRYLRLAGLALGALLWWVIPTVVVSQMTPGVSYWLQWPLLFSLIGLGLLWFLPEKESSSWRRVVLLAGAALPALLLFAWTIYAFYLTLGTDLTLVPVLLMALMLGLFIPHLGFFAHPYRWALPATAGLVVVAALIVGSLTVGPDATNPYVDSIFYALDADTGQALWVTEDPEPDVWTSQFLGTTFKRGNLPRLFPHLSNEFLFAPAPVLDLTVPQVDLLNDHTIESTRTLHLHITAPEQVPWVEVSIESTNPISAITLAGRHIPYENDLAQSRLNGYVKIFQYWVPPAEGFAFSVEVSPPGYVKVFVRNYGFGLPHIPGFRYKPRPADRMPLAREFLPKNKTDTVLVTKSFVFD
jgi:hypothetical protein